MTQKQSKRVVCVAVVASSLFVMNLVWAATGDAHPAQPVTLSQLQGKTVPAAMEALMAAKKAIQAGHTDHALAELAKLELALMVTQKTLDVELGLRFVNATCPMSGESLDPATTTDDLIRVFQGKKVAFCCADCLGKWDALVSTEKQAKFAASLAKPAADHDHAGHAH